MQESSSLAMSYDKFCSVPYCLPVVLCVSIFMLASKSTEADLLRGSLRRVYMYLVMKFELKLVFELCNVTNASKA